MIKILNKNTRLNIRIIIIKCTYVCVKCLRMFVILHNLNYNEITKKHKHLYTVHKTYFFQLGTLKGTIRATNKTVNTKSNKNK